MVCPRCGSALNPDHRDCSRCHNFVRPTANTVQSVAITNSQATSETDRPSFWMALIGFLIPLAGLILYLTNRETRPLHARSAGRGAALGLGFTFTAIPLIFLVAIIAPAFMRGRKNAERAACQRNLQELSLAAINYSQAHNGKYPDLTSPASLRLSLKNYVKNPEIFACPVDHQPYQANIVLSRTDTLQVVDDAVTILFYEGKNAHYNGHNVSYVDGHVKWLSDSKSIADIEPIVVTSKIDVAYDEAQSEGYTLIRAGKFAEIEKQAALYRKSEDKLLNGFWKLAAFYQGISEVSDSDSDAEWEKRRQLLAAWVKRNPRSITAHVALVRCYHDGAYRARGTGWGKDVKKEQWELMEKRLAQAAKALAASAPMQNQCPGWFAAAQRIVFLEGRPKEEFDAITDEGLRRFPDYDDFHFMRAKFLMPRWYGEPGDWQVYAEQAADNIGKRSDSQAGDILYARIVWYMQGFTDADNVSELAGMDWPRSKRGFEILMKKPDSFGVATAYARTAWLAGDKKKAKALFENTVENHMEFNTWTDESEFQSAKKWALQP